MQLKFQLTITVICIPNVNITSEQAWFIFWQSNFDTHNCECLPGIWQRLTSMITSGRFWLKSGL